MLVTGVTTGPVAIPHEPGETMEFRKISYLTLDKAKKERMKEVVAEMSGTKDIMSTIQKAVEDGSGEVLQAAKNAASENPLNRYHKQTLLHHGVHAWSYKAEVTFDTIDELDETTADWAARQIIDLALPGEADTKELSSRSTGT